jgi:hypothetical protein
VLVNERLITNMDKFRKLFGNKKTSIIGMIHLRALPGTPQYESGSFNAIIEKARHEANIYAKYKLVRLISPQFKAQ